MQRIEVGWRGTAGAVSDGGFTRFCSRELEEGKGMHWMGSFQGLREEKSGVEAQWPTCGGAHRRQDAGMGGG